MRYQPLAIEDYGLIGDCRSCALVGRNGSIDWLCWPRFDSPACFAALLGDDANGRWLIAPHVAPRQTTRRYRDNGLVLETTFRTDDGEVVLIDFMARGGSDPTLVRIVEGRRGQVQMSMEMGLRFDYGTSVPWVTRTEHGEGIVAVAGPSLVALHGHVPLHGRDMKTIADFTVREGERKSFTLSWRPSHLPPPPAIDVDAALAETASYWENWAAACKFEGPDKEAVRRSLVVLKALTHEDTGGIVAAATTSLPETLGGERNWDYRYCWLRDATLTLFALMSGGYYDEAFAWRDWLHRAVAGSPEQIQIMYGLAGERSLLEWEVPWLLGYQGAKPVRIGNAAAEQLQLDVYGEVIGATHQARRGSSQNPKYGWPVQRAMVEHLETIWNQADEGMWEVRGGRKNFVVSKAFCWFALDRSIDDAETYKLPGPVERWRALAARIHAEICDKGFSAAKNSFKQSYESETLDAGLLLLPAIGFLPASDPRIAGTIAAVERELLSDGFVLRYRTDEVVDGLHGREGAFLACSFWLADAYALQGRDDEARALFDRLLGLRNDLGLLAEEYDPVARRLVGNFPQAFSHTALVGTATRLSGNRGAGGAEPPRG